jgi:hypothetical protein
LPWARFSSVKAASVGAFRGKRRPRALRQFYSISGSSQRLPSRIVPTPSHSFSLPTVFPTPLSGKPPPIGYPDNVWKLLATPPGLNRAARRPTSVPATRKLCNRGSCIEGRRYAGGELRRMLGIPIISTRVATFRVPEMAQIRRKVTTRRMALVQLEEA